MKHPVRVYVLMFSALLLSAPLKAQEDSSRQQSDSLNNELLQSYNKRLAEIAEQHIADSIKKADLERQLQDLKTSDREKEALQKQLEALNDKEAKQLAEKKARIDSLRANAKAYPVNGFFKDTLLLIYSRLGSFSAAERAEAISERIKALGEDYGFNPDSLKVQEAETTSDVVYGETVITSVSENDALWNNTTRNALAKKYRQQIAGAVTQYKEATSVTTLLKEFGLALLTLLVAGVIIYYANRLFRWASRKIIAQRDKRIKGIRIRNYTLFNAGQQVKALLSVAAFLKWAIILLCIYIVLPVLFGIFPWTQHFAETLFGYILSPLKKIALGIWDYMPKLFTIAVIIFVFRYVLKGLRYLKQEVQTGNLHIPGFYQDWANPTYQIIRVLVFAFMLVVIFPYLPGSDSPVFKGVSVFLGFLFTFGSAGSLSNVIAGLVLTYMRLFKLGDRVKIGEVTGDVIEKSMLVTRIRTIKNEIISIPNSTVMSSHTINYSSDAEEKGLILHTTVTIGYDVPWKTMHQALLTAADRTPLLLKEPKPFVLQTSLDDFYVSYQLNAYTREPNRQAVIYSDLHANIQDCCNEAGIEIMSPHYRAARDGSNTTIPASYLDKDYQAPPFKIKVEREEGR